MKGLSQIGLTCAALVMSATAAHAAPKVGVINPLEDTTSPPAAAPNACPQGTRCGAEPEAGYEPDPNTPGNELLDSQDPALEQRAVPAEEVKEQKARDLLQKAPETPNTPADGEPGDALKGSDQ